MPKSRCTIYYHQKIIACQYFSQGKKFWWSCFQTERPISLFFLHAFDGGNSPIPVFSRTKIRATLSSTPLQVWYRPPPIAKVLWFWAWRPLHFPTGLQPTGNRVNPLNPTLTFSEKMSPSTQLIWFIMLTVLLSRLWVQIDTFLGGGLVQVRLSGALRRGRDDKHLSLYFQGAKWKRSGTITKKASPLNCVRFLLRATEGWRKYIECSHLPAMCTHVRATSFAIVAHGLNDSPISQRSREESSYSIPSCHPWCPWHWKIIPLELMKLDGNSLLLYRRALNSWRLLKGLFILSAAPCAQHWFLPNRTDECEQRPRFGVLFATSAATCLAAI